MIKKLFKGFSTFVEAVAVRVAPQKQSNFFFMSTLVVIIVSFFSFFPLPGVNGIFIKSLVLPILSGILLIIFALQSLKNGSFTILDKKTSWGLFGFLIVVLISSVFSVAPRSALFGTLGEAPSSAILFSLAIIFFIASISVKKFSHVLGLLVVVSVSYFVTFIHIVSRVFFGSDFLSFGFLDTITSTFIGSWTDFGILSLLVFIFALICLEMGKFVRFAKWITIFLGVISLAGLFLVNIGWLWILAGLFSLVASIYIFSVAYWDVEKSSYSRFRVAPWYSLISFIVILVGILFGSAILGLTGKSGILAYQEIYPSLSATVQAGVVSFKERPLTGVGLGSFDYLWNQIKPVQLSGTSSGATEFSSGYSFITTILATTGVLGIIAIIGMVILVGNRYYRVYQNGFFNISERFTAIIVIAGSLVLTLVSILDYPGVTILVLWAIFMGALWGVFSDKDQQPLSFIHDPRTSFLGMIIVLFLIFVGGSFVYINARKSASVVHYSNSAEQLIKGNQNGAITSLVRANKLWRTDYYNRVLANQVLTEIKNIPQETLPQEVQRVLSIGLSYADAATQLDVKNYRNWVTLGDVYQFFAYLKMEGASQKAYEAYTQAKKLSPNNTIIDISFADLELLLGNNQGALNLINESIARFPTANAYVWLYQQNVSAKQLDQAENNLMKAVYLQPTNIQLVNQLGGLMFSRAKYQQAIPVFERSLFINRMQPVVFAYLGASYESVGKTTESNQIFEFLKKEFPEIAQKLIDQVRTQRGGNVPQANLVNTQELDESLELEESPLINQ